MPPALYNALWYAALPVALIVCAGRDRQAWRERLGGTSVLSPGSGPCVWIHAASVGEIEAVRPVATGLAREFPKIRLVITTMTAAGRDAARRRIPNLSVAQLAPFDCSSSVRSFIRSVRPDLLLIAETELWPNYFIEAARLGAKVAVINGRISARSARRYRMIANLAKAALAKADLILAQTVDDAERYRLLGAPGSKVIVTGNTKFDAGDADAAPSLRPELSEFAAGRPILIAGSTAPGEEKVVLLAYQRLLERFPDLALVIAPRHLNRTAEFAKIIDSALLPFVQASQLNADSMNTGAPPSVLLLDTMGELRALYRRATIVFVGGSLEPGRGGQNPAEPAVCGVPVMFGPYHENQREPADALLAVGSARIVRDAAEIASTAEAWLSDMEACSIAGENARAAILRLGGGARKTLDHLRTLMPSV